MGVLQWASSGHDPPEHRSRLAPHGHASKLGFGVWGYTARQPRVGGSAQDPGGTLSDHGIYWIGQQLLLGRPTGKATAVWVYAAAGFGAPEFNRFAAYSGGGLVVRGLIPERGSDRSGLAVALADNADSYLRGERSRARPVARSETSLEATYLGQLTGWLSVQADVQYVIHPNTDPTVRSALGLAGIGQLSF